MARQGRSLKFWGGQCGRDDNRLLAPFGEMGPLVGGKRRSRNVSVERIQLNAQFVGAERRRDAWRP